MIVKNISVKLLDERLNKKLSFKWNEKTVKLETDKEWPLVDKPQLL